MKLLTPFIVSAILIFFPDLAQAQPGVAPTVTPSGGFAVDGNLLAKTPTTAPFSPDNGDFLPNDAAPGTGGFVFTLAGLPVDTAMAFHLVDGYDAADAETFYGGSKFNNNPNTWLWKSGKPPMKDDINHALFFFSSDADGNLWFIGSGDRKSANGNTYLDFELLQNPLYKNANGTFNSTGPDGGRTVGDLALTVWYTNGGSNATLYIHQWTSTGPGTFSYQLITPAPGTTLLSTNKDSVVVVPYGAFGASSYPKGAFTEVACNLNDLILGSNNCLDIKTVIVKTKASQSLNAELKDVITPIQVNIGSAPVVTVNSDTICYGDSATLTATVVTGVGPFTYLWNTGETTESITVSPDTTTTYTVVVTGANGCPSDPASGTVTVLPLPEVSITGPDSICYGDTAILTANVLSGTGPFTYLWSTGDTTQMITVAPDTTTLYTVVVTGENGCPSEPASFILTVLPLPTCFITGPDTICPAGLVQFSGPDSLAFYTWTITGSGTIQGSSTDQSVEVLGGGICDSSFVLTLVITNENGCTSMCMKEVFFLDSISPVITDVPEALNLSCASEIPLAGSDTVTVTDNCEGEIALEITDSIISQTCANQFTMIRTWTATDLCGNTATATQDISVFDSIPPILLGVPADTGVCCGDSVPLPALVTATDNCDTLVVVEMTEVITDSIGPNMFILTRTWTAEDECGNSVTDSQVITVNDTLYGNGYPMIIPGSDESVITSLTVRPNPFIYTTEIRFSVSKETYARVELYNPLGVQIKTLHQGEVRAGVAVTLTLSPDPSMQQGVYLLVLKTNHGVKTARIILIK